MSRSVYPIVLHPEENGTFTVDIPDLQIGTQGDSVADSMEMARDAIGIWGICRQDAHQEIPAPSDSLPACAPGEIATFVDIDFDAYRRANDRRTVRKNVTLPSWLCDMAEKAGINFSQTLQEALKLKLDTAQ